MIGHPVKNVPSSLFASPASFVTVTSSICRAVSLTNLIGRSKTFFTWKIVETQGFVGNVPGGSLAGTIPGGERNSTAARSPSRTGPHTRFAGFGGAGSLAMVNATTLDVTSVVDALACGPS